VPCYPTARGCFTRNLAFAPDGLKLATGHQDGTILLWKVPPLARTHSKDTSEVEPEKLWEELGSSSPGDGLGAMERLASRPAIAVPLITAKLSKIATPPNPDLAILVKDLDSDAFATRERASRKLLEYGAKAEAVLRDALAGAPSPEMKRRIEEILQAIPPALLRLPLSGDTLRWVRAIEVLEHIGTPEAREVLKTLANGAPEARLTQEARFSLDCLQQRAAKKP
jgi:hypothetical protein